MSDRRNALKALGASILAPAILTGQNKELKRSRWDLVFGGGDTKPAGLRPDPSTWRDDTVTAAWLGHATVLINFYGVNILTDPVLSGRIGLNIMGLTTIGPKRLVEPALKHEDLPRIDLILLSHAHMDHLDLPSLERFDRSIPIVMAKNTSDVIDGLAMKSVAELDWGETTTRVGVQIEAVQVRHFGWRFPWETDRSRGNWNGRSYNAYVLTRNGKRIFFGGDTARQEFNRQLGERGVQVDLAIMPIGAYDPWVNAHCNPEEAVAMADAISARTIMPIHWGTFIQSDEPTNEPIERFKKALSAEPHRIALEAHGQTWVLDPKNV